MSFSIALSQILPGFRQLHDSVLQVVVTEGLRALLKKCARDRSTISWAEAAFCLGTHPDERHFQEAWQELTIEGWGSGTPPLTTLLVEAHGKPPEKFFDRMTKYPDLDYLGTPENWNRMCLAVWYQNRVRE